MEYIKLVKEGIEYMFNISKDILYTVWVDTDGLFDESEDAQTESSITYLNKN